MSVIATTLMCLAPVLVLPAGEKPTALDNLVVEQAKVQCAVRYPKSPCLKSVTRNKDNHYKVLCTSGVEEA